MVRRLALNTTPEIANRAVDEVFGEAPGQKYRSHVWALLPTSVIKHLQDGAYMAIDVFGEKTEFPAVRDRIIAQLNTSPTEPFSDFLLYTLGRFDDAIQFNQKSPLRTVLVYAAAHSKLRKILSKCFKRFPGLAIESYCLIRCIPNRSSIKVIQKMLCFRMPFRRSQATRIIRNF